MQIPVALKLTTQINYEVKNQFCMNLNKTDNQEIFLIFWETFYEGYTPQIFQGCNLLSYALL